VNPSISLASVALTTAATVCADVDAYVITAHASAQAA